MTANALKGDRDKLLNAGMTDYIAKPVDIEELDRVLERVMCNHCCPVKKRLDTRKSQLGWTMDAFPTRRSILEN